MAGLGEACSHIAALLFTLEANTQMKKRLSCTSLPCSWLPPSFRSVPYAPISEIDFSTPRQKRMKTYDSEPVSTGKDLSSTIAKDEVQEPTAYELDCFYGELSKVGKPAILSLISRFSDNYVPLCKQGVLSMPLTDLFKPEYMALSYPELLAKCGSACAVLPSHVIKAKALKKMLVIKLALRHGSSKELAEPQLLGSRQLLA